MNRNGSVMLTFFPAVGQRKYDYTKKQVRLFFFISFVKLNFLLKKTTLMKTYYSLFQSHVP
jgi:hypothetical protein